MVALENESSEFCFSLLEAGCAWLLLFFPIISLAQDQLPTSEKPRSIAIDSRHDCDTPLLSAVHEANVNEVTKLIAAGADPNKKTCQPGETALVVALANRLFDISNRLILAGADPNLSTERGTSPLMAAATSCSQQVVVALLKRGARINDTDSNGEAALMNAALACRDGSVVAVLIRAGANVNLTAKSGYTALITALLTIGSTG